MKKNRVVIDRDTMDIPGVRRRFKGWQFWKSAHVEAPAGTPAYEVTKDEGSDPWFAMSDDDLNLQPEPTFGAIGVVAEDNTLHLIDQRTEVWDDYVEPGEPPSVIPETRFGQQLQVEEAMMRFYQTNKDFTQIEMLEAMATAQREAGVPVTVTEADLEWAGDWDGSHPKARVEQRNDGRTD